MKPVDVAIICAFSCQNSLPSAVRDGQNLTHFWLERGVTPSCCHVFVERIQDTHKMDPRVNFHMTTAAQFPEDLLHVLLMANNNSEVPASETIRVFLSISSHGDPAGFGADESDGQNESFRIGASRLVDDEIRLRVWKPLLAQGVKRLRIFALVDACHSGTMLDLPWTEATPEGPDYWAEAEKAAEPQAVTSQTAEKVTAQMGEEVGQKANGLFEVVCFSACRDSQMSMDDFSVMGFGGGLCSAFLDFFTEADLSSGSASLSDSWLHYLRGRLIKLGQTVVTTTSHRPRTGQENPLFL